MVAFQWLSSLDLDLQVSGFGPSGCACTCADETTLPVLPREPSRDSSWTACCALLAFLQYLSGFIPDVPSWPGLLLSSPGTASQSLFFCSAQTLISAALRAPLNCLAPTRQGSSALPESHLHYLWSYFRIGVLLSPASYYLRGVHYSLSGPDCVSVLLGLPLAQATSWSPDASSPSS